MLLSLELTICSPVFFLPSGPHTYIPFCSYYLVFALFLCSRWSFVDVSLIFSCPADHGMYGIGNHVYDWVLYS